MADETVYSYLSHPSEPNFARPPHPSRDLSPFQDSRWHQIAVWIGWVGNAILLGTVIVLVFQIGRFRDALDCSCTSLGGNSGINKPSLENASHLRQYFCMSVENTSENASCKVCPQNWNLHEKKCYWISTEKLSWNKSVEDCTAKFSQMLVIQRQEEMTFLENITKSGLIWIGVRAIFPERKWTWVNGSPFNDKLSHKLGPAKANSCGQLNGNQIISESCIRPTRWMCEKEILFI